MRFKVFEGLSLVGIGLVVGITATMIDVFAVGSATFVSHVCLWVLLNTLLACHVESRVRALWWSAAFNFGFIESFFITTAATYEGYLKSTMVSLAAMAVLSPLLVYGLWTVKNSKNLYGKVLSFLVGAGVVGLDFAINRTISIYGIVCAVITVVYLGFVPTRKIKISPGIHPVTDAEILEAERVAEAERAAAKRRKPNRRKRASERADEDSVEMAVAQEDEGRMRPAGRGSDERRGRTRGGKRTSEEGRRRRSRTAQPHSARDSRADEWDTASQRPTRRTGSGQVRKVRTNTARGRREEQKREERARRERRVAAEERRSRRSERSFENPTRTSRPATLGHTREATRSRRGSDIYGYE